MKKFLTVLLFCAVCAGARADEGMWLLPYLEKMNIKSMKSMGLKLSAKDIYSASSNSLKDAIVIFGGGCTGEVVSSEGLVLTNHHCGYSSIQALSSVEHDYLKNGFWAMNRSEEIPAPGLEVKFIRGIEEVTDRVIGNVPDIAGMEEREKIVNENINAIVKELEAENPGMTVIVKSYFEGNQYFAIIMEVFTDVRLVGTPPSSMGKFGGDTDNWMWPRHTCDFSMFRIYAGKDNRPAAYSADNVPYKAPVHLKISKKGYKEGDFTMIMGFPGSTTRYMTSYELEEATDILNADRIFVRGERQKILKEDMSASDKVRIQYASKYAGSSNYWKNSIGMNRGVEKLGVKARKQAEEQAFQKWADASGDENYANALPRIKDAVEKESVLKGYNNYLYEAFTRGVEMIGFSRAALTALPDMKTVEQAMALAEKYYKDYNEPTDRRVAKRMFEIVKENIPAEQLPDIYAEVIDKRFGGSTDAYVDYLYDNSIFSTREKLEAAIPSLDEQTLKDDPAYIAYKSINNRRAELISQFKGYMKEVSDARRSYVKGILNMNKNRFMYPDANFTIRLTYGQVLPYSPADGVTYNYYTTMKGVVDKEDLDNPMEFTVPEKLKECYAASRFGGYDENGRMNVCFLSNNDITGGNSGSPVMNAKGELIGLAFDGNWEAMSGDIVFEPELQRCINVDIRYVLWVIDVFADAGYLLDEMTIVK